MLASMLLFAHAPMTQAALVDDLTARYGYGVIGTAAVAPRPVEIPNPENALDTETRLKNVWRVTRDAGLPGIFRPTAGPYKEVFEEMGPGMPMTTAQVTFSGGSLTMSGDTSVSSLSASARGGSVNVSMPLMGKPIVPLPKVELADLARPGGVRVRVGRLIELLKVPPGAVPHLFLRRSALVRLDPKRTPEPVALIAAMVGGTPSEDGKRVVFEPRIFRSLAIATLEAEAAKGVRTDPEETLQDPATFPVKLRMTDGGTGASSSFEGPLEPKASAIPAISAWERERPLALRMGAAAHREATDEDLRFLYEHGGAVRSFGVAGFERLFPEIIRRWRREGTWPSREARAWVRLGTPHGLGTALLAKPGEQESGEPFLGFGKGDGGGR